MASDVPVDSELLRRYREGSDSSALGLLFERHAALAYRVALGVLCNRADAEDAAQDAFLRLIRFAPRVRAEGSLAGLIARMALRTAQDLARASGRRRTREAAVAIPEGASGNDALEALEADEERAAIRRAVQALHDRYRLPIELHYFQGLTTEQTAQALGVRPGAVRVRLSRAVGKLRRHLQREGMVVAAPALAVLLAGRPAEAAPATLAARLAGLGSVPAPAGPTAALLRALQGLIGPKLAAASLVVVVSLGGIGALRRLPPPRPAGATGSARSAPLTPRTRGEPDPSSHLSPRGQGASGVPCRQDAGAPRAGAPRAPLATAAIPLQQAAGSPRVRGKRGASSGSPRVRGDGGAAPAGPLTRDQERRLAAEVLEEVWRDPAGDRHQMRGYLPRTMAMVDLERAQAWVRELPPGEQTAAGLQVIGGMLAADPQRGLDQVVRDPDGVIARAEAGEAPAGDLATVLVPAAGALVVRDPAAAGALLDRAEAVLARDPRQITRLNAFAIAAGGMRDRRGPRLAVEVLRRVEQRWGPEAGDGQGEEANGQLLMSAERLAYLDPDAALKATEWMSQGYPRRVSPVCIAPGTAHVDPARALLLLEQNRPGPEGPSSLSWSFNAREVARVVAATDPAKAEALARSIPDAHWRAKALAYVAGMLPPERAAPLRREALEAISRADPQYAAETGARVAELFPRGPDRTEACLLVLDLAQAGRHGRDNAASQIQEGPGEGNAAVLPDVAFHLAADDPEAARLLLEDALAVCGQDAQGARLQARIGLAYCALDPVRAAAIVRAVPGRFPRTRLDALHQLALHLATAPEKRADVPFALRTFLPTWLMGWESLASMWNWETWAW